LFTDSCSNLSFSKKNGQLAELASYATKIVDFAGSHRVTLFASVGYWAFQIVSGGVLEDQLGAVFHSHSVQVFFRDDSRFVQLSQRINLF
jgi:hypothetical protein